MEIQPSDRRRARKIASRRRTPECHHRCRYRLDCGCAVTKVGDPAAGEADHRLKAFLEQAAAGATARGVPVGCSPVPPSRPCGPTTAGLLSARYGPT